MAATLNTVFIIFLVAIILFIIGRHFKDYTTGLLGGLMLFLLGFYILVDPISTTLSSMMNTAIGSILFGLGAYIFVSGSIELLKYYEVF